MFPGHFSQGWNVWGTFQPGLKCPGDISPPRLKCPGDISDSGTGFILPQNLPSLAPEPPSSTVSTPKGAVWCLAATSIPDLFIWESPQGNMTISKGSMTKLQHWQQPVHTVQQTQDLLWAPWLWRKISGKKKIALKSIVTRGGTHFDDDSRENLNSINTLASPMVLTKKKKEQMSWCAVQVLSQPPRWWDQMTHSRALYLQHQENRQAFHHQAFLLASHLPHLVRPQPGTAWLWLECTLSPTLSSDPQILPSLLSRCDPFSSLYF